MKKSGTDTGRTTLFACLATITVLFLAIHSNRLAAQVSGAQADGFEEYRHTVQFPYAGKYEARIGGSSEPDAEKLRLDIGASIDIYRMLDSVQLKRGGTAVPSHFSVGADFFTWTRLRSTESFKFPVEAVDYYFGINAAYSLPRKQPGETQLLSDIRLRVAHISAHLVDGDVSFTNPQQQYITYSREFADLFVGINKWMIGEALGIERGGIRPYIGGLWLFHTIPDTLGTVTPYAGVDVNWQPAQTLPITLRAGYEARLNTELEPIGEHLVRGGVKLGTANSNGVSVEAGYYAGRSQYGQHFGNREKYFFLGFTVDY